MRLMLLAAVAALAFATSAGAVPHCTTGKLCGNACIAKTDVCHIPPPVRNCGAGKLCGKTCIPKTHVCHK